MANAKILAFAGSIRTGSFNDQLINAACAIASDAGAEVNHIQLSEYTLPLFDQDLEARDGQPENAEKLKELFNQSDGLLLACPEYNSSITPLLKNTIDWVSRKVGDEQPLEAYTGKTACLVGASPGAMGGLRGLRHVREILSNIGVWVAPNQFALGTAFSAFNESGKLNDEQQSGRLKSCVEQFVTFTSSLAIR